MSSGKIITRSGVLRSAQNLILALRLNYILKPFAAVFQKLYCLLLFADWKKKYTNASVLTGYTDRYQLYTAVINTQHLDEICYLEFGVSKGESIKWWLNANKQANSRFFGFDTFEGIPEDWGTKAKGSYTNEGKAPSITDIRCEFVKGLFQESLQLFLRKNTLKTRLVIHFDADLYSATLFCLFSIAAYLKSGDILIFDEFDVTTHEFRSFLDFQSAFPVKYTLIGESNGYNKIVLRIT
jgi:O-methyltransferase